MDQKKNLTPEEIEAKKEKRRAWDREYQKKRYHEKGKPQLERYHVKKGLKDLDREETMKTSTPKTPETPNVPIVAGKDHPIMQVANLIKEQLPADDPVVKAIDRYGKYVPIVMSFVEGFTNRMNEARAADPAAQRPKVEAPEGWLAMSALQREVRKYDAAGNISPWYQQGMYYEQVKTQGQIKENIASHMPVNMDATYAGQIEAQRQARMNRMPGNVPLQKYKSMAEVNAAAKNEKWDKAPSAQEEEAPKEAVEEVSENPEELSAEQKVEIINKQLNEDVEKYMGFVVGYFKTRPLDQFEKDLSNIDDFGTKYKPILDLLPVQVKAAMQQITYEQLEEILKQSDPAKLELVKKKKLKKKLQKMWEELKKPSENNKP